MTEPEDPARLSDPSQPAGLRDVLRAARNDVGTDAQLARLAQRLGPMLGPPVAVAPVGAGLTGAAKLGLAGLVLITAGGGAWLLSTTQSASPAPSAPTRPTVQQSRAASPAPSSPPVAAEITPPVAVQIAAQPALAPATANSAVKPTLAAQPSEAELLEQARAAMKADPARALQRANEHAARFPRGVLVQEREVIAIQALRQLGRVAEADRRAAAFVKAFPGSAFARKLSAGP